ncbi:MAG: ABC transporter substrate-binding protein [Chloroflexi bacterium]|nr:ABC transporter substrate-binding protein [Chloroflexota bacterium]
MSYKPTLATSWDISDDLTQWTFQLRRDVKFHNGKEFKAEDVVYNFTRIVDPDVGSPAADQFSGVENIVAIDDYTVRFELSRPNAFFLDALAVYHARIIPKGIDIETLTNGAVGTGPFTLEEYVVGEFATLKRNPNYWDEGLPYLDEVTFLFMAEDASRLQVLKAGDVDVEYSPAMTSINEIENDPGIVATMVSSASYQNLVMNTTKPPFDDKLVRNAFQLATDRELINQATMFGYGTIANDHAIPPTDPLYATDVAIPPYDPAGARALLELAGYMNGIDVDLHTMARYGLDDLAVAFKESAEPAGIRVNIIRDPEDTYWGDVWMQYPFVTSNWSGRPPVVAFGLYYKSGVAWNESFYSNPELDALLAQAEGEPDLEARKVMFSRMQEMLVDDAPVIIGTFQPVMWFNRDYVKGIEAHPLWMFYLHEAWLDK